MARILAGELDPDSVEARAAAARDPKLRAELAEMAALEGRLAAVGGEIRAGEAGRAEGEDAAVEGFRRHAGGLGHAGGRLWRIALAAAALIAAVAVGVRLAGDRADVQPAPRSLGSGGCVAPTGAVRAYATFAWDLKLPPNGAFELDIRDASGMPVLRVPDLGKQSWTPGAADLAKLPERIRWRVIASDGTGSTRACEAEAWIDPASPR